MINKLGYLNGYHITYYATKIKTLKKERKYNEVIKLLLKILEITEKESIKTGLGVAPWYYGQLSIIYKKTNDLEAEIKVLERFKNQIHSPGVTPQKLLEKLIKLKIKKT